MGSGRSIFILAGGAFEKETDSNKIYAYSASIIALVSCIVSILALLGCRKHIKMNLRRCL